MGVWGGRRGQKLSSSFLQTKVAEIIGAQLIAQEACEFFVLLEKGVLPVGTKDMMAMFDLIEDGGQLSPQSPVQADAEDLTGAMGGKPPKADLAAALEDLVNGE